MCEPLVTVYIPTCNRIQLLKRAIESVLNQTYKKIEVIIVDDCSVDGTSAYLKEISKKDSRVRFFLKEQNTGACESRNIAINNAYGEFITGLDDDDYFLDNRVEEFVKKWYEIDEKEIALLANINILKTKKGIVYPYKLKKIAFKNKITYLDLRFVNYIGNQVFTKTETLRNSGGFDTDMPAWQDLETWYRVLKNTGKKCLILKFENYIHDISHDHERITNLSRHSQARKLFLSKHQLSKKEQNLCFLLDASNLNSYILFKRLCLQFTLVDFLFFLRNLFK